MTSNTPRRRGGAAVNINIAEILQRPIGLAELVDLLRHNGSARAAIQRAHDLAVNPGEAPQPAPSPAG